MCVASRWDRAEAKDRAKAAEATVLATVREIRARDRKTVAATAPARAAAQEPAMVPGRKATEEAVEAAAEVAGNHAIFPPQSGLRANTRGPLRFWATSSRVGKALKEPVTQGGVV